MAGDSLESPFYWSFANRAEWTISHSATARIADDLGEVIDTGAAQNMSTREHMRRHRGQATQTSGMAWGPHVGIAFPGKDLPMFFGNSGPGIVIPFGKLGESREHVHEVVICIA